MFSEVWGVGASLEYLKYPTPWPRLKRLNFQTRRKDQQLPAGYTLPDRKVHRRQALKCANISLQSLVTLEDVGGYFMSDTVAGVIISFEISAIFWTSIWHLAF